MKEPDIGFQNSVKNARRVSGTLARCPAHRRSKARLGAQLATRVPPRNRQLCLIVPHPSPSLCQPFYGLAPQSRALSSPFGNSGRVSTAGTLTIACGDSIRAILIRCAKRFGNRTYCATTIR